MAQFVAFSPGVEVNGETVYTIIDGMGFFKRKATQILVKHGIEDPPQAGRWYNQQSWLDAFQEIAETIGERTLFNIGARIPENAKFPPAVVTIEDALASIDVAYHLNHRNGEIGQYRFEKTAEHQGSMVCQNPYPCAFDMGIIDAIAKKFRQPKRWVRVEHIHKTVCRKKGADACTYSIIW